MGKVGQPLKHGMCKTRIYQCWADMKRRCNNQNSPFYHRYGGRGIKVCDDWNKDFLCFYKWAMENGYRDNLSLDRIDNDGNYEPANCKWSTQHEQSMNKTHLQSKTGYVGVRKKSKDGFVAEVFRYGQYYYIGTYKTPEEANEKRIAFLKESFGEE